MLVTLRCGCVGFLVFAGLMVWLVGWKTVLIGVAIMIALGFIAGLYVRNRLRSKFAQMMASMMPPQGRPGGDDRHDLWVCAACGGSSAAGRTNCDSCGEPAP